MKSVHPVFIYNNIVSDSLTYRLPGCEQLNGGSATILILNF